MTPSPPVVDASVAIKWLVRELLSANAVALLRQTTRAGQLLVAPPLLPSEVTNGLYQQVRRGHLAAADAEQALVRFRRIRLSLTAPADLYERAFAFATANTLRATYDSLYVVLAEQLGTVLWTADQRLLTAVGAAAPWVRSLAEYRP